MRVDLRHTVFIVARSLDRNGDALPGGEAGTPRGSPLPSTKPDRRTSWDVYSVAAVSAFVAYVLVHLVAVSRSHIPWFDDTFFASVSDSLARTGHFTLAVSPLWFPRPVFLYGPTYFLLVAGFFAKFGIGVLQYRLTGLIAAFALLVVAFRILQREGVKRPIALAACALMATDPILLEILRVGRMDLLAVLFFLLGFLQLLNSRRATGSVGILYSASSGALVSLGVLTTPRPGYLLLPIGLILLHRCYVGPTGYRLAQLASWTAGFAPFCVAWIAYAFGGPKQLLAYFSEFAGTFAGTSLATVTVQKPLLAVLLVLTLLVVIKEPRRLLNEFVVFNGLAIALFFLLVRNTAPFGGGYTILAVPFEYMVLGWLVSNCPRLEKPLSTRTVQRLALIPLFLLNGGMFVSIVASDVFLWHALDQTQAARRIAENIPPGSRVIGDDKFYFLVKQAGSDFQYLERGGTLAERVKYHRDTYGFEYIVTALDENSETLSAYRDGDDLEKVGEIEVPSFSRFARYPLWVRGHLIMWGFTLNYGGAIYKRVR